MALRRRIRASANGRRSLILGAVAALAAAPLVALGGGAPITLTQQEGTGPIDASVVTVPIAEAINVTVDDAAIATQSLADGLHPDRGVVKEIRRAEEFSMFALTWYGDPDVAVFVRAERPDGTWSQWYDTDADNPSDTAADEIQGTELLYIEPTRAVQISTHGLDIFRDAAGRAVDAAEAAVEQARAAAETAAGSAGEAPAGPGAPAAPAAPDTPAQWADIRPVADEADSVDVNAVLIDGDAGANEGIAPIVDATNVTGMPQVITRSGWGANESIRCGSPTLNERVKGTTVHHTAGSNNYTEAQAAGIVRGIYQYHAVTRGWCDIGYNALVDKYGNIYEGRYGGLDKAVQGAHSGGFNKDTWAISILGNYESVAPTQASITAVGNMLGWRLSLEDADPTGTTQLTSGGSSYARYPRGTTVTLPRIFGHRDTGQTTCPGDSAYARLAEIRAIAKAKYDRIQSGAVDNEAPGGDTGLIVDGDGEGDGDGPSAGEVADAIAEAIGDAGADDGDADADGAAGEPPAAGDEGAHAHPGSVGSHSIFAAVLGLLGAPGIGQTADELIAAIGGQDPQATIADIPVLVDIVLRADEDNDFAAEWREVLATLGGVLGEAESGVQTGGTVANDAGRADPLRYVKFSRGIITSSRTTGTHALWGEIADAWAARGFETGPLGAPVGRQTRDGDLWRVDFQHGSITFDEATGEIAVHED